MQNIEVTRAIDAETNEVFRFVVFDLILVFSVYLLTNKPKGKRNWKVVKKWDNYNTRDSTIDQPVLTDDIRELARHEFKRIVDEGIKVKTWDEYRPPIKS